MRAPLWLAVTAGATSLVLTLPGSSAGAEVSNGRLVFVGEEGDSWGRIYSMALDGTDVVPLTPNTEVATAPEYSPDGRRIAYSSSRDAYSNIYTMAADGTDVRRLTETTFAEGGDMEPTWSPDGMRIVFTSTRDVDSEDAGGFELYSMAADGSEETRLTHTAPDVDDQQPAISPDGTHVAFVSDRPVPDYDFTDLFVLDLTTGETERLTFDAEPDENHFGHFIDDPVWSPDGSRLLFSSDRSMDREIWMINADGTGLTNLTQHPDQDTDPTWSPDGTTISWTSTRSGQYDVWSMPAPGTAEPAGQRQRTTAAAPAATQGPTNLTPSDSVTATQPDWQTKTACDIVGTPGPDLLVGTSGADVICGFGGNDVLRGRGGDDQVRGGPGADTVKGGAGRDNALGGAGIDQLRLRDHQRANDQGEGGLGVDNCLVDARDLAFNC